ncbi:peptidylprolyl isomerase [Maliponia aquimaris]|uniref:Parvulin-like PPIase n=1 Tax=Maliponia aquimaris TaxID=1673631 RepID=A0A238L8U1_9RHOB|nr:peptidylprolyl isomerase [Maliponia aquimaris]SMX50792.1 putative parvulin-type peptidyl-prolyl cis-trans isomerase precursor [Maliponia aquimaris]
MSALFPTLVVNGETVPAALVAAEAQNHSGPKGKPGIAWRKAANAVAIRTLLLQEARARGIEARPEEVGPGRWETEEEALVRGLLAEAVAVAPPGDAEVRAEWERDPQRFRAPPLWEVSHILVACDPRDPDARQATHARAVDLARRAHSDPGAFARLARETSECGSGAGGGALGQLSPGDTVPEFEAVLRSLSEGEITADPVLTRHGWHIIRMDAVAPGAVLPYDAVRPKIREAMEKAAWDRMARDFVQTLVASAEISGADLRPAPPGSAAHEDRPC